MDSGLVHSNGNAGGDHLKNRLKRQRSVWEVIEGLRTGQRCAQKPQDYNIYLYVKRKWPLKGWRKRYCVLCDGILRIAKSQNEFADGRISRQIDTGLSVISFREIDCQIDIDCEDNLYHFKVKGKDLFVEWIGQLKSHRLFRQDLIAYGSRLLSNVDNDDHLPDIVLKVEPLYEEPLPGIPMLVKANDRRISFAPLALTRVANSFKDLSQNYPDKTKAQRLICELDVLLLKMEKEFSNQFSARSITPPPNLHKHSSKNRKLVLFNRPKKKLDEPVVSDLKVPSAALHFSCSSPDFQSQLPSNLGSQADSSTSSIDRVSGASEVDTLLRNEFLLTAQQALQTFRSLQKTIEEEREHLRELTNNALTFNVKNDAVPLTSSLFSMHSVYHDAIEKQEGNSDSSSSECDDEPDEIISDEESDDDSKDGFHSSPSLSDSMVSSNSTKRRQSLPSVMPSDSGVSLWNILSKNIGRDLSRIAMPIAVHEPLSALQVLCEELEYSDLLDQAVQCQDASYRMVLISAFAISCYSSTLFRAERKPFNPLLGETFECIREDKRFRFIAEQVSHHPPVSAAFAQSDLGWKWWQDARVKIKFWGKSMEIQPLSHVNVVLEGLDEHYSWNKATCCIHNILNGQRWVDHYGFMTIVCPQTHLTAKLHFEKASKNIDNRYRISGSIIDRNGILVNRLHGKWSEGLYLEQENVTPSKCIWKPDILPARHHLYYGFTRFAIELNEITSSIKSYLPPTDSRLRPDQRLLEDGCLSEAEVTKYNLETKQRERRKLREDHGQQFIPNWFKEQSYIASKEPCWLFTDSYWQKRNESFKDIEFEPLW